MIRHRCKKRYHPPEKGTLSPPVFDLAKKHVLFLTFAIVIFCSRSLPSPSVNVLRLAYSHSFPLIAATHA